MTNPDSGRPGRVPPAQHNLQIATDLAVGSLRDQSQEQMRWLGATPRGEAWQLPVLGAEFSVRIDSGAVTVEGRGVAPAWRLVALHYLAIRDRNLNTQEGWYSVRSGNRDEHVATPLPPGLYYLQVYKRGGAGSSQAYRLVVQY